MNVEDYVTEGLNEVQYGMHILQEVLSMPSIRSNIDLMSECLISIGKTKRLDPCRSYKYMVRAIKLAQEQGISIDLNWFRNGEYSKVRPQSKSHNSTFCGPECKSRHGRGYHTNDIQWLLTRYMAMKDSLPSRPMTDYEIDRLLGELDSKRSNGAPDWRR